jgi:uncharacterized membrane protein YphA (DoxX/SURF4 family)
MIHVIHNGKQEEPASEDEIRRRLAEGGLSATDLAWREGLSNWKPLSNVLQASGTASSQPPPPPTPFARLSVIGLVCAALALLTCFLPGTAESVAITIFFLGFALTGLLITFQQRRVTRRSEQKYCTIAFVLLVVLIFAREVTVVALDNLVTRRTAEYLNSQKASDSAPQSPQ